MCEVLCPAPPGPRFYHSVKETVPGQWSINERLAGDEGGVGGEGLSGLLLSTVVSCWTQ